MSEPLEPTESAHQRGPDQSRHDRSDHIALVGLMGSGKTSVGEILAARTGHPLIDTDRLIEANTGTSIAQLFQSEGEAAFRRYEVESLRRALLREEPAVIATGGGIVLSPEARHMLTVNSTVVWLQASPEVLAARLGQDASRPLLGERDALVTLTQMLEVRGPLYEEVTDFAVAADLSSPEQVADAVLTAIGWEP